MCTPAQCKPEPGLFLDRLNRLSSAEDFFAALEVPFEQTVLNIYRLHILKAFHDNLDMAALRALEDGQARTLCRYALEKAYTAFASGEGKKSFKVFNSSKTAFVPLSTLSSGR